AVIVEVDKLFARTGRLLCRQIWKLVVAVEMDFEGLAARLMALEQLLLDVRIASGCHQRRQPVESADHLILYRAGLDPPRPADHAGYTERAFPVGVLRAAERRCAGIRPGILVRAIVGRVDR